MMHSSIKECHVINMHNIRSKSPVTLVRTPPPSIRRSSILENTCSIVTGKFLSWVLFPLIEGSAKMCSQQVRGFLLLLHTLNARPTLSLQLI